MKKMIFGALVCAGMLAFGACSYSKCNKTALHADDDQIYTGLVPGADVYGIRYTLSLDYDDDMKDGDFKMVQTYVKGDSIGYRDVKSFKSKGDFIVETRGAEKYLKLMEKGKAATPIYFQVTNDSTLTMVTDSLQPAPSGLDYTLKLVR